MEVLPLEKPLLELNNRIEELRISARQNVGAKKKSDRDLDDEIATLEKQFGILANEIFSSLTPYEITQLSRHPNRPYTLDIVKMLCDDFIELHGDRNFMDDASIVAGLALFRGHRVVV